MGAYIYVSEQDRIKMRRVSDPEVNEEFQEALKYDPSLMIEEYSHSVTKGFFKKRTEFTTRFTIYHESPGFDKSTYQARIQASASGEKKVVIAYLHGIINGVVHSQSPII